MTSWTGNLQRKGSRISAGSLGRSVLAAASALVIVAGCGGGGGSGGSASNTPPAAQVVISQQNSPSVASGGYRGANSLNSAGNLGGTLAGGVVVAPAGSGFDLAGFAAGQLEYWTTAAATIPAQGAGVATSAAFPCTSGSGSVAGNIATSGTLSSGDSLTATFNNCVFAGATLNGAFSITFVSTNGILPPNVGFNATASFAFNNFSATQNGTGTVLSGGFTFSDNIASAGNSSIAITGASLSETSNGVTESLSGYTFNLSKTATTYNYTASGRFTSTAKLNGYIDFTTPVAFTGTIGSYPTAGQLIVTGANHGSVRMTVASTGSVSIEVDTTGSGTYVAVSSLTWAQLAAL